MSEVENDLLSVIVPAYNCEGTIVKCLESILNQSYQQIEIIIVNDGSTDNTCRILCAYQRKYSNIHVIHINNSGVSSARNTGLMTANGGYITFVDSDDYLDVNFAEKCIRALVLKGADIVSCGIYQDVSGKLILNKKYNNVLCSNQEALEFFNQYYYGSVWGKIYKKSTLVEGNGVIQKFSEDIFYSEDELFWCKAAVNAKSVFFLADPLYYYVINSNSISHQNNYKKKFTRFIAWERICEEVSEWDDIHSFACGKKFENAVLLFREMVGQKYFDVETEKLSRYIKENEVWYRTQSFSNVKITMWQFIAMRMPTILRGIYKSKIIYASMYYYWKYIRESILTKI